MRLQRRPKARGREGRNDEPDVHQETQNPAPTSAVESQNQHALTCVNFANREAVGLNALHSQGRELLQERETNHYQGGQANSFNHLDVDATLEGQLAQTRMSLKRALTDSLRGAGEALRARCTLELSLPNSFTISRLNFVNICDF